MQTVVGFFETLDKANQVKRDLGTKGFSNVTVLDQSGEGYRTGHEDTDPEHNTVGGKIKHFFSGLAGSEDNDHELYTQGVARGGALVSVDVAQDRADEVADYLDSNGATQVQEDDSATGSGYAGGTTGVYDAGDRNYGTGTGTLLADTDRSSSPSNTSGRSGDVAGYTGRSDQAVASGEQVIPVVAEELRVGKRQVSRGGVRVFSRVVSENASEQVSLHDERVVVNRRTVDRPATEADFNPETRSIELTATGEEAVVGKTSHVVEEVVLGKQGSDRVETVGDTVRHTEIDVQPVEAEVETVGTSATTNRY